MHVTEFEIDSKVGDVSNMSTEQLKEVMISIMEGKDSMMVKDLEINLIKRDNISNIDINKLIEMCRMGCEWFI